jgi:hypothetical protein
MYFDNVGGAHFEAAMMTLRPHGRVAVCGGITHYNEGERQAGLCQLPRQRRRREATCRWYRCLPTAELWRCPQQPSDLHDDLLEKARRHREAR